MTSLLHFVAQGPADGIPLVLVHPLGADRHFWDEAVTHLGPGVRSIRLDLRGSGQSPDLDAPLTLQRTVDDIEAIRRHLGLPRLVVAGCAIGAMAAALYAARHADHALGLVMSNPAIRITRPAGENLTMRADKVRREGMGSLLPDAIDNAFVGYADSPRRHEYEARFVAQGVENYALACLGAVGADLAGELTRVLCPTLLVVGANDRLMAPANAEEIASLVPHAQTVEFADGAHFIPYQQPLRFAETVMDFLERNRLHA